MEILFKTRHANKKKYMKNKNPTELLFTQFSNFGNFPMAKNYENKLEMNFKPNKHEL